ncbi:DUF6525 family protein [Paracoccus jiaweipingae]|uniref:DUF6525 family protein n=1 Tax=unclassified Paracoccus (in: a-proteobacteria) TaxID=2688777 RepID=UPI003792E792
MPRPQTQNLRSSLPRRSRCTAPMAAHDALPAPARQWAAQACLPWSAASIRKIWSRHAKAGDISAALAALDRAEARMLARDRS